MLTWSAVRLSTGAAVSVTGKWTPSQGQGQAYELQAEEVKVLGENDATVRCLSSWRGLSQVADQVSHVSDKPNTKEVSDGRVSSHNSSSTESTTIQLFDSPAEVLSHSPSDELLRET